MEESLTKLIIDTDIGEDIDDTWALVYVLSSQFVDVKLISVTTGDVKYKAKIVAKILTLLKKTNIPIALGIGSSSECYSQKRWVNDFSLDNYQGVIFENVSEAYKKTINKKEHYTVLGLAPFSTLSEVKPILESTKTKIIAMAGSINRGYFGSSVPSLECNVATDVSAFKNILESSIDLTLIPLDVCGDIVIRDKDYQQLKRSKTLASQIIKENYAIWQENYKGGAKKLNIDTESSYLYDVAVILYVLFWNNFSILALPIEITDDGYTVVGGNRITKVALNKTI